MQVHDLSIEGLKLIDLKSFPDERGFFVERFQYQRFSDAGLPTEFVQDNFSRSSAGVLRGLHYQYDQPQGKLVTCLSGKIQDIAVDIRKGSATYGKYESVVLEGSNPQWLWIPKGFAHGFAVLGDEDADILYKVDAYYNGAGEGSILWSDPDLAIDWQIENPSLSPKDLEAPSFNSMPSIDF